MEISDKKFPVWYRKIVSSQPYVSRNYHVEVAHSVPIFFCELSAICKSAYVSRNYHGEVAHTVPIFFCVFIFLNFFLDFCIFLVLDFFSWLYPLDKHKNSGISQKLIEILEQDPKTPGKRRDKPKHLKSHPPKRIFKFPQF